MKEIDPKKVDGEPHEVAEVVGKQAEVAFEEAIKAIADFYWAARGAWLTSEDHLTGHMPKGEAFDYTVQGRKLNEAHENLKVLLGQQRSLTKSAAWNPKSL